MKNKKLILATLALLAVVFSGITFAYWAGSITGASDSDANTIQIGTGETVSTTLNVTSANDLAGNVLVPVGQTGAGKVSSTQVTFSLNWDGDGATGAVGSVAISTSVMVGTTNVSHLFTVTYTTPDSITAGTVKDIIVTVTFANEPADVTEYNLVADQDLIVTLSFTVTPA